MVIQTEKILFNHTVFTLLKSLSKKEKEQFGQFLQCTYFNSDNSLVQLFKSLQAHVINQDQVNEAILVEIYAEIFLAEETGPLIKKQKKALLNKMSQLTGLLKTFLAIDYMQSDKLSKATLQYKALLQKNQLNICSRQLKKDKKLIEKSQKKNLDYFFEAYQIEQHKFEYLYQAGLLIEQDNIDELNYNLDMHYLISKLKIHTTTLSVMKMSNNKSFDFSSIKIVNNLLELPQYIDQPILQIYSTINRLVAHKDESDYLRLLKLLNNNQAAFSETDLNEFYTVALNFCITKIRRGELEFNKHAFELYQIMESKNLLIINEKVNTRRLRNVITQSCKVGDFEWAKFIIDKYIKFVNIKDRNDVFNFNAGAIAFYENDFKKAIHHLIRVESKIGFYQINSRMLLLKSHFHLDSEYDERTMRLYRNTLQHVLNNKKLPPAHKEGYKNFMTLLINLYKLKHGIGKITLEKLSHKIEQFELISDKTWLVGEIGRIG